MALLEHGASGVNEVAKKAGVNRSSAYVVLENLAKKGLVGISGNNIKTRYIAASPETLLHLAEEQLNKQQKIPSFLYVL